MMKIPSMLSDPSTSTAISQQAEGRQPSTAQSSRQPAAVLQVPSSSSIGHDGGIPAPGRHEKSASTSWHGPSLPHERQEEDDSNGNRDLAEQQSTDKQADDDANDQHENRATTDSLSNRGNDSIGNDLNLAVADDTTMNLSSKVGQEDGPTMEINEQNNCDPCLDTKIETMTRNKERRRDPKDEAGRTLERKESLVKNDHPQPSNHGDDALVSEPVSRKRKNANNDNNDNNNNNDENDSSQRKPKVPDNPLFVFGRQEDRIRGDPGGNNAGASSEASSKEAESAVKIVKDDDVLPSGTQQPNARDSNTSRQATRTINVPVPDLILHPRDSARSKHEVLRRLSQIEAVLKEHGGTDLDSAYKLLTKPMPMAQFLQFRHQLEELHNEWEFLRDYDIHGEEMPFPGFYEHCTYRSTRTRKQWNNGSRNTMKTHTLSVLADGFAEHGKETWIQVLIFLGLARDHALVSDQPEYERDIWCWDNMIFGDYSNVFQSFTIPAALVFLKCEKHHLLVMDYEHDRTTFWKGDLILDNSNGKTADCDAAFSIGCQWTFREMPITIIPPDIDCIVLCQGTWPAAFHFPRLKPAFGKTFVIFGKCNHYATRLLHIFTHYFPNIPIYGIWDMSQEGLTNHRSWSIRGKFVMPVLFLPEQLAGIVEFAKLHGRRGLDVLASISVSHFQTQGEPGSETLKSYRDDPNDSWQRKAAEKGVDLNQNLAQLVGWDIKIEAEAVGAAAATALVKERIEATRDKRKPNYVHALQQTNLEPEELFWVAQMNVESYPICSVKNCSLPHLENKHKCLVHTIDSETCLICE